MAALLLVVRSYDVYGVPAGHFHTAKRVAGQILERAGVNIQWIACPVAAPEERCATVPAPSELIVRITRAPEEGGTLGYAYIDTTRRGGSLATLYGDRIATLAQQAKLDGGTLLGRTLAHEIGHLLLGSTAHPKIGLMRARWSAEDLRRRAANDWVFTRRELEEMRLRVGERLNEPAPSLPVGPRVTVPPLFASGKTLTSSGAVPRPHEKITRDAVSSLMAAGGHPSSTSSSAQLRSTDEIVCSSVFLMSPSAAMDAAHRCLSSVEPRVVDDSHLAHAVHDRSRTRTGPVSIEDTVGKNRHCRARPYQPIGNSSPEDARGAWLALCEGSNY